MLINSLIPLIVAVFPVYMIGLFIYKRDKKAEPLKLLFKIFFFGVLCCFPAAYIGSFLGSFLPDVEYMDNFQLFIYVFIIVAFVEEFCKWFVTYMTAYNHKEFDASYDMIVYSVFAALGFACFENILYVMSSGVETGILRAISAVPGHTCDGIIMGLYLGMAKLSEVKGDKEKSDKYKIFSVLVPTITHGIYDYCLFVGNSFFVSFFIIFVIAVDIFCLVKVFKVSKNTILFKRVNSFCPNCGTPIKGIFCTNCGKKIY